MPSSVSSMSSGFGNKRFSANFSKRDNRRRLSRPAHWLAFVKLKELLSKEHVTPYFYDHFKEFRIVSFTSGIDSSDSVHCIDDWNDFERAEEVVKEIGHDKWSWQDLDGFLQKRKFERLDKVQAG